MKKLGFGIMRLPTRGGDGNIVIKEFIEMVDKYLENGFNYFDTAYIYHNGKSEGAVKRAVTTRYKRDEFFLADKMPTWLVNKFDDHEHIFKKQLARLGVEYLDLYLLHAITRNTFNDIEKNGGFDFLCNVKNDGRAKHIGFSYHDSADLLDEILSKYREVDFVQLQINYIDWNSQAIQSRKCYEVAVKHNKQVIVMEPVKGGALAKVPPNAEKLFKEFNHNASIASWAIRFAASLNNVFTVLSGMSNLSQLEDNMSFMREFLPLSEEESKLVNKAEEIISSTIAVGCTGCRYCISECPKNIPIADFFSLFNDKKQFNTWVASFYYKEFAQSQAKASDCISCRKCEKRCPQHIEIAKMMSQVSKEFDS